MNLEYFIKIVKPLTVTSIERITRLFYELEHIRINNISGDLIECGVYKGGNILGMMEYCHFFGLQKTIWLYDTFSGMTSPIGIDVDLHNNKASDVLSSVMCEASLSCVKSNLSQSSYDKNFIKYIVGDVCKTLLVNDNIPNKISLLRLDTDWYESTMCELQVLFPRVVKGGSIIIDDYGHWKGCRKAVNEFFNNSIKYHTIDYTGIYFRNS